MSTPTRTSSTAPKTSTYRNSLFQMSQDVANGELTEPLTVACSHVIDETLLISGSDNLDQTTRMSLISAGRHKYWTQWRKIQKERERQKQSKLEQDLANALTDLAEAKKALEDKQHRGALRGSLIHPDGTAKVPLVRSTSGASTKASSSAAADRLKRALTQADFIFRDTSCSSEATDSAPSSDASPVVMPSRDEELKETVWHIAPRASPASQILSPSSSPRKKRSRPKSPARRMKSSSTFDDESKKENDRVSSLKRVQSTFRRTSVRREPSTSSPKSD